MGLSQRLKAAAAAFILRLLPPRPISADDLAGADFSTHPGGKGLRLTDRLREALLRRWLRVRP